jgi:hypothetical protein
LADIVTLLDSTVYKLKSLKWTGHNGVNHSRNLLQDSSYCL